MLEPVNIHNKLIKERNKSINGEELIGWVYSVLKESSSGENSVLERLQQSPIQRNVNNFNIDFVETDAVFHISQIQKICVDYRLRFLDTRYFKGNYPDEVVSKIQALEAKHQTTLDGFKIIAPSKLFHLEEADDPLLFAPMGNDYYYLIHTWGKDLHPLRKLKFWWVKNIGNMAISLAVISLLLTLATYPAFHKDISFFYFFVLFMFFVKGTVGFFFFYGVASGQNFSEYCWQSKYNKIS